MVNLQQGRPGEVTTAEKRNKQISDVFYKLNGIGWQIFSSSYRMEVHLVKVFSIIRIVVARCGGHCLIAGTGTCR